MEGVFYELSLKLTGQAELSKKSTKYYYDILVNEYSTDFTDLLVNYKATKKVDTKLEPINLVIVYLWYTAELVPSAKLQSFTDPTKSKFYNSEQELNDPIHYYDALIWKAAHSHSKGLTGGYFGYWKYRPEN